MKRVLRWFVLPMVLMVIVLVIVANLLVDPAGELSPPDPALVITLPDGRREALGELLERAALDVPQVPPDVPDGPVEELSIVRVGPNGEEVQFPFNWSNELAADETDLFRLGQHAMRAGRVEEALALLLSVTEDHKQYDTAQRFIGWELLTKEMDRPALGLAYINRALDAAPLEGENWQDASRVYLRTLGIRWDPVNNIMR